MKIHKKVILLLLFVVHAAFAQWVQISTIGNYELRAVKFFNVHTGIVAGEGGIWRSTNSGLNWMHVLSGQNMNAVSFADINVGFSVGDTAKIYKTTNGGVNWSILGSPVTQNLNGIWFVNQNTGYAVGDLGKILKSTNSGASWQIQTSQFTEDLNGVHMTDAQNGYIIGSTTNEICAGTGNGGFNWLYNLNLPNNTLWAISSIPPSTANVIAVGSNGRIRRSTSFGTLWTLIASNSTQQLNGIQFLDGSTGFIVGNNGTILMTTNSGLNWNTQSSSTSNHLKGITFINVNTGWAVGDNGVVLRSGIPVGINHQEIRLKKFRLYQNFPNPFNPSTKIKFDIMSSAKVNLSVYDGSGNLIDILVDKFMQAGEHNIDFQGQYPSGIFFFQLEIDNYKETIKAVLIK